MSHNAAPHARVTIVASGQAFTCRPGMSVLEAMERALCREIPVGCRNGGCGACLVQVLSGGFETGPMNRAIVSDQDRQSGRVLACRTKPLEDLKIEVLGRHWKTANGAPAQASAPWVR